MVSRRSSPEVVVQSPRTGEERYTGTRRSPCACTSPCVGGRRSLHASCPTGAGAVRTITLPGITRSLLTIRAEWQRGDPAGTEYHRSVASGVTRPHDVHVRRGRQGAPPAVSQVEPTPDQRREHDGKGHGRRTAADREIVRQPRYRAPASAVGTILARRSASPLWTTSTPDWCPYSRSITNPDPPGLTSYWRWYSLVYMGPSNARRLVTPGQPAPGCTHRRSQCGMPSLPGILIYVTPMRGS